jgi:NADH:ubiquinone oxidoreductase subunit E
MTLTDSSKSARNELRRVLREKFTREHGQLLPALHYLQHEFGFLPDWGMEVVSWHLGIPASEVYGAATSYVELRVAPPGDHVVRVCTGLACRVAGGDGVLNAIKGLLGVEVGETTGTSGEGETVTLEDTACGFLCGVAPAIQIDGRWHGRATPERSADTMSRISKGAGS